VPKYNSNQGEFWKHIPKDVPCELEKMRIALLYGEVQLSEITEFNAKMQAANLRNFSIEFEVNYGYDSVDKDVIFYYEKE